MIYTGCFFHTIGMENLVSIARTAPSFYKGQKCSLLNPSAELLAHWKKHHDIGYYTQVFEAMLAGLDVHAAAKALDGKVLLCWEGKGSFCHRQLVAKWFRNAGYKCIEL